MLDCRVRWYISLGWSKSNPDSGFYVYSSSPLPSFLHQLNLSYFVARCTTELYRGTPVILESRPFVYVFFFKICIWFILTDSTRNVPLNWKGGELLQDDDGGIMSQNWRVYRKELPTMIYVQRLGWINNWFSNILLFNRNISIGIGHVMLSDTE